MIQIVDGGGVSARGRFLRLVRHARSALAARDVKSNNNGFTALQSLGCYQTEYAPICNTSISRLLALLSVDWANRDWGQRSQ